MIHTLISKLGIERNHVVETILSTRKEDGQPNAAPMGISLEENNIIVRPYKSTLTYRNLKSERCGIANITSDPSLYYRTVFKDVNPSRQLPPQMFEEGIKVRAPRIVNACGYLELSVASLDDSQNRTRFVMKIEHASAKELNNYKAYSRAHHAVMESIIHTTRLKVYLKKGDHNKTEDLIKLVAHYQSIVEKIAPKSVYSEMMDGMVFRIDNWRSKF